MFKKLRFKLAFLLTGEDVLSLVDSHKKLNELKEASLRQKKQLNEYSKIDKELSDLFNKKLFDLKLETPEDSVSAAAYSKNLLENKVFQHIINNYRMFILSQFSGANIPLNDLSVRVYRGILIGLFKIVEEAKRLSAASLNEDDDDLKADLMDDIYNL